MNRLTILTIALITSASFAEEKGEELYKKLIERYQSLSSYQDEGETVYYLQEGKKSKQTIKFKTHYSDPNLVRFEFLKHDPNFKFMKSRHVIWFDGKKSYSAWDKEVEEVEYMRLAFAGATGISMGTAPKIPSLLLDYGIGAGIHRLEYPKLVGTEEFDGRQCFHLKASGINLWVSKDDLLIRKIDDDGTEIHLKSIIIDEEIPKTVFQLTPKNRHPTTIKSL